MLYMKSIALMVALLLLSAARAQSAAGLVEQPDTPIQEVNFCQLAKTPAAFAGKSIRVRGIYRYVLEENDFGPSECCPEEMPGHFHAIINGNPMYPNAHSERLARKLAAQMSATALVVFVGTLSENDGRVLNVDRVERIERLSHPKDRHHEPAWVPQNCGLGHVQGE
jgi:hypothetical protein